MQRQRATGHNDGPFSRGTTITVEPGASAGGEQYGRHHNTAGRFLDVRVPTANAGKWPETSAGVRLPVRVKPTRLQFWLINIGVASLSTVAQMVVGPAGLWPPWNLVNVVVFIVAVRTVPGRLARRRRRVVLRRHAGEVWLWPAAYIDDPVLGGQVRAYLAQVVRPELLTDALGQAGNFPGTVDDLVTAVYAGPEHHRGPDRRRHGSRPRG